MKRIKFYLAAVRWLWQNRHWHGSRQKWKAFCRALDAQKGAQYADPAN